MVEDDVENRLHARRVQRVGRRADLFPAAGSKTRIRRAEHDRVISPRVGQAERRQVPLVDERVGRHDLDGGDPEICQMFDRSGMSEACERPAGGFGDRRVKP